MLCQHREFRVMMLALLGQATHSRDSRTPIPGPSMDSKVIILDPCNGNHFEKTVTLSNHFADKTIKAHQTIDARW